MQIFKISAIALAIGFIFSTSAVAEKMTKNQYQSHEKSIASEYKADKAKCDSFSGNSADICVAEAKGKQNVAKSELEATYNPSTKTRYQANIVKADAAYSVAIEKCDDISGNNKDVCVKEAKAAKVRQTADAKTMMESKKANAEAKEATGEAQAEANEKSKDANAKAAETKGDVMKDANAEKRDADYTVAKEKCDGLAGNVKDKCVADAKLQFSQ